MKHYIKSQLKSDLLQDMEKDYSNIVNTINGSDSISQKYYDALSDLVLSVNQGLVPELKAKTAKLNSIVKQLDDLSIEYEKLGLTDDDLADVDNLADSLDNMVQAYTDIETTIQFVVSDIGALKDKLADLSKG